MSQSEAASSRPPDKAQAYPQLLESPLIGDCAITNEKDCKEAVETEDALDITSAGARLLVVKLRTPAQSQRKETGRTDDQKRKIDIFCRRFDWGEESQPDWSNIDDKMATFVADGQDIRKSFKEAFKKLEEKVLESEKPYTWTSLFDPEEKKIILQLLMNDITKQHALTDLKGKDDLPYVYDDIAFYITHRRVQKILENIYIGIYVEEDEPSEVGDEDVRKEISESENSQETAVSSTSSTASLNCRLFFYFDLTTKVQPFIGAQIQTEQNRLLIQGLQHDRLLRQNLTSTEDDAIQAQEKKVLERVEGQEEKTGQVKEVFQTLRDKRNRQKKEPVEVALAACGIAAGHVLPPEAHY